MRPSQEQGVVAVLDTQAECSVVLAALEDTTIPKPFMGPSTEDFKNSTAVRFRKQTQFEPRPPHASAYVEPIWKARPEFNIEIQDVDFVKQAAVRILEQRKLSQRLLNLVTKRTKAAKNIIKTLESVSV